jgi:multiple sugar transport system substrate-binding protein
MVTRRDVGKIGIAAGLGSALARPAWAADGAQAAVEAAKQYAGTEITIVWEAGLQSLDPLNFSGPKWKELTGIDVNVIEVPVAEMFTKILQEHRAGAGAYDALNVIPSWMPTSPAPARSSRSTPMSTSTATATNCRPSPRSIATTR